MAVTATQQQSNQQEEFSRSSLTSRRSTRRTNLRQEAQMLKSFEDTLKSSRYASINKTNAIGIYKKLPHLSAAELSKIRKIAARHGIRSMDLITCMAFETGGTLSPSIGNGSHVGLIQMGPDQARMVGTSTAALARMSRLQQLEYVGRYLERYRGKIHNLKDLYAVILAPSAVMHGRSALFSRGSSGYRANRPLDANKDGKISKHETVKIMNDTAVATKARYGRYFRG